MSHTVTKSAVTPGACGCCGGTPENCFSCRQRGTLASLCAYFENQYYDPDEDDYFYFNTPPKAWRKVTLSGSFFGTYYATTNCTGTPTQNTTVSYSGNCQVYSENCVQY